jgi:glucose dehydrogenase
MSSIHCLCRVASALHLGALAAAAAAQSPPGSDWSARAEALERFRNGRQYVVIAAGGGGKIGSGSSDAFVAFALPDGKE